MVRTSSSNPMSIIRSASSRQRYLKCTVKKIFSTWQCQIINFQANLTDTICFWNICEQSLIYLESRYSTTDQYRSRIYKMDIQFWLFWAVEAAEKKKSKLPWVCYFWGQFFHVFMAKKTFFKDIVVSALKRYIA